MKLVSAEFKSSGVAKSVSVFAVVSVFLLSGCGGVSGIRDNLGLDRQAPDEFAVVKRAPLEIPDDLSKLPEPTPGKARPQEESVVEQAKEVVLGEEQQASVSSVSSGEEYILKQSGALETDDSVRAIVDEETEEIKEGKRATVEKLFGLKRGTITPEEDVIDPKAEQKRLEKLESE